MLGEVARQPRPPGFGFQQDEGGEVGQVVAVVEDQRGFEAAVGEEGAVGELRQLAAIGAHGVILVGVGVSTGFRLTQQ